MEKVKILVLCCAVLVASVGLSAQDEPLSSGFVIGPMTSVSCSVIRLLPMDAAFDVRNLEIRVETVKVSFKRSVIEVTTPVVRKLRSDREGKVVLQGLRPDKYVLQAMLGGKQALGTIRLSDVTQSSPCVTDIQVWPAKEFIAIGNKTN